MAGRLRSVTFRGPAGALEGLWKEASEPRRGSARLRAPASAARRDAPQQGRLPRGAGPDAVGLGDAAVQLSGRGTLGGPVRRGPRRGRRLPRGPGRGRAHGGRPMVAGGFSFGSAVGLKAIAGDPRVAAFVALGVPLATESGAHGAAARPCPRSSSSGSTTASVLPRTSPAFLGGPAGSSSFPGPTTSSRASSKRSARRSRSSSRRCRSPSRPAAEAPA